MQIPQYQTLEEKERFFGENYFRISTPEEFDAWWAEHKPRKDLNHYYRGVPEACYKNYSTAQREMYRHNWTLEETKTKIAQQIKNLHDYHHWLLHDYCATINIPCTDLFLLSFAQHYGGKTPLIDFTSTIYNALFFMQQQQTENSTESADITNYASIYLLKKHHPQMLDNSILEKELYPHKKSTEVYEDGRSFDYQKIYRDINNDFLSTFSFNNLNEQAKEMPIIMHFILYRGYSLGKEPSIKMPILFTNLNILAQHGSFVYNTWEQPLDQYLECVDIKKSLLPYIKEKYIRHLTKEAIYPDPRKIIKKSYII